MPLDTHERNIKAVLRGKARTLRSRGYDIVEEPLPPSLAELMRRLEIKRNKSGFSTIEWRRRGHGEPSMDRDQYLVVLHKGEWKIKHNGRHAHPYETQADAISSAIEAAHAAHRDGGLSQVLVQGQDLLFRTEWTYGKDPCPPPG
jgi:Uncharacterized protein conserved in bacteria (DUF2188)